MRTFNKGSICLKEPQNHLIIIKLKKKNKLKPKQNKKKTQKNPLKHKHDTKINDA